MMIGVEVLVLALLNIVSLDGSCQSKGWVCGETACFNLYGCHRPFDAAMDICRQDGVTLVSISSEEERVFLTTFIKDLKPTDNLFWTGGNRTTTTEGFSWLDGSPFPFPAEVSATSDLCLMYRGLPEDDFLGEACDKWHQFICRNGSGETQVSPSPSPSPTPTSTIHSDSAGAYDTPVMPPSSFAADTVSDNVADSTSVSSSDPTQSPFLKSSFVSTVPTSRTQMSPESQSHMFQSVLPSDIHLTFSANFNSLILESSTRYSFSTNTRLIDISLSDRIDSLPLDASITSSPNFVVFESASTLPLGSVDADSNTIKFDETISVSKDLKVLATRSSNPETVTPAPSTSTFAIQYSTSVVSKISAITNPPVIANLTHVCGCCWSWYKVYSTNISRLRQDDLLVIKRKKLKTADDTRVSARGIGGGAVALLVVGFLAVVVMDAGKLMKDVHQMYRNLGVLGNERHGHNGLKKVP